GLHKERHEAQLHAVLLQELVLVFLAQLHHARHVHLVEGGEQSGRLLGFDQSGCDTAADEAHWHRFFLTVRAIARRANRLGLTLDNGRGCRRLFLGGHLLLPAFLYVVFLDVPQHVFLEQPTTRAGRRNVLRRQTVLVEQTAGRRHHAYAAHFFLALGCRVV